MIRRTQLRISMEVNIVLYDLGIGHLSSSAPSVRSHALRRGPSSRRLASFDHPSPDHPSPDHPVSQIAGGRDLHGAQESVQPIHVTNLLFDTGISEPSRVS
jgi:hypothetical protein